MATMQPFNILFLVAMLTSPMVARTRLGKRTTELFSHFACTFLEAYRQKENAKKNSPEVGIKILRVVLSFAGEI